ncbi:2-dehydropantoate 2-reductase [Noviherbaspirillum sp. ST9]|uniref:2-dehydropantoate 2-reductase n=1 Tax=Noviherbaspirillum sp. ST9 TaxID=3401606 RepID=UPI003B589425
MKIVVFGAGSIGVYVGCSLLAAGADVLLIGRARMGERIARQGVVLTDLQGKRIVFDGPRIPWSEDPGRLAEADLILVTVKSADTAAAADAIHAYAKPSALVLSLQNGVGNVATLRNRLKDMRIVGGMVPFNVVQMADGRFHRGTEGELMVEAAPGIVHWLGPFEAARLPLVERTDFASVLWGKLLLNLNNSVNALSGLPLKAELSQRAYRRCLALLIEEALDALRAAGIVPAKVARVAPAMLPRILRLPDWLFKRLAGAMLRIDPEARSSMWEDLQAGRRTEVDYLNGAVVALAHASGRGAPANERVVELIRRAEAGKGKDMDGAVLYHLLSTPALEKALAKA